MLDRSQYRRLTLLERTDFSEDLAVFHFRSDEPVEFTPGQYATIGLTDSLIEEDLQRPLLRPYSVASAPNSTELEFFIERVEDGELTTRLWRLQAGDDILMRKRIVGRFVLNEDVRQHVMVATVTGVGPYVSILRAQERALSCNGQEMTPHRMLIIHGASRSWELGTYHDELTRAARKHDWVRYVPTVSRPWEDPDWEGERGRAEDVLRKHLDASAFEPAQTAAYTCGHPKMIDKAQGILQRAGFPEERIHEEKYFRDSS